MNDLLSGQARPEPILSTASLLHRYQLRFAAEALRVAWKRWRGARCTPGRGHGWARLAAQAAACLVLPGGLLLPALSSSSSARALTVPYFIPYPFPFASQASPAFADIDADGDLDAFVGNGYGRTVYFENAARHPRIWLPLAVRSG